MIPVSVGTEGGQHIRSRAPEVHCNAAGWGDGDDRAAHHGNNLYAPCLKGVTAGLKYGTCHSGERLVMFLLHDT